MAVVTLVVVVGGVLVWWLRLDTYHLVTVHDGVLYRDGNRGMREFMTAVRRTRPKTVICLVDDREILADEFVAEQAFLKRHGIEFVRIPIVKGDFPTTGQVREFLRITTDPQRQPVLFHDNEGIRRAGMMMAAYQESVLGYDDERAKADVRAFGHSERTVGEVRQFIEAYDGRTRALTVELAGQKGRAPRPEGTPAR